MKSLHGDYISRTYKTDVDGFPFGFCNEAVHSNPFDWRVVDSLFIRQTFGYSFNRAGDEHLRWIYADKRQVSASSVNEAFLHEIIQSAQRLYVLSM